MRAIVVVEGYVPADEETVPAMLAERGCTEIGAPRLEAGNAYIAVRHPDPARLGRDLERWYEGLRVSDIEREG